VAQYSDEHPSRKEVVGMAGTVARVTEISATSDTSFDDAVKVGVERANQTLRNVRSAWVKEQQVRVEGGSVVEYQVNLLVTFVLDD
jgi:flavin-binding protein dodecin